MCGVVGDECSNCGSLVNFAIRCAERFSGRQIYRLRLQRPHFAPKQAEHMIRKHQMRQVILFGQHALMSSWGVYMGFNLPTVALYACVASPEAKVT